MARADLVLLGNVVKFEPAALAVHDALGTQDVTVVAAVELREDVVERCLGVELGRFLAPGGEHVVGVVMMVMALARGIVALLAVVVMVMLMLFMIMAAATLSVVVMMMLMLVVVVMMLVLMVVLVMLIMVMVMLMLGLLELVLAAHLLEQLVAERHLLDGGEDGLAVQFVPRSREDGGVGVLLAQQRGGGL